MQSPRILLLSALLAAAALAACGSDDSESGATHGTSPGTQTRGDTTGETTEGTTGGDPTDVTDIDPGPSDDLAVLTQNRAAWDAVGPDSYVFTYEWLCFCPATATRITVVDGEVTAVEPAVADQDLASLLLADAPTMEAVFDQAADELATAEEVSITYDDGVGFPTVIDADRIVNAIDDELTIQVSGFEPLD